MLTRVLRPLGQRVRSAVRGASGQVFNEEPAVPVYRQPAGLRREAITSGMLALGMPLLAEST